MSDATPDYLRANVEAWENRDADQLELAGRAWASSEPSWGLFGVPESEVRLLPDDVDLDGAAVAELGCGTAYVSAWLARRGARPVGIDPTPNQLRIARRLQGEHDLRFPLVLAMGEQVPLRSGAFDLVISEYGAAIWADPYRWIPEAARLLRPGGRLIFLGNSVVVMLCVSDFEGEPAAERLRRAQRGMHRFEWPDDPTVEFHVSHGDRIRLLRGCGFEIEDLVELYPPADAEDNPSYDFVTADWARRWPCEEVWVARRM